jgi:hypothetical protein
MGEIFSATDALAVLTDAVADIGPYVLAVFGVLAGATIAIRWFKRGTSGVASGKVK